MAKQLFLNNVETTFLTAIKDTPVTGTPATELGYGILQVNTSTSAALSVLTGGDYYVMTALKRAGSVESTIEVMRITAVDTATFPGECRLTVSRAQEGTTAKAYLTGDYLSMRLTKGALDSLLQTGDKDLSGGVPGLTLFKINMRNVANTFTSWLTNTNTAARTYTFQDRDGTIADNTDLAAKQSTSGKDASGGYAGLTLFQINFKNAANTFTSFFTNTNTAARTYTFQDRSGTIADNTDLALKAPIASPTFTGTATLPAGSNAPGLLGSSSSAVTATGTTQGTATALTSDINVVTTSTAGTGLGVVIPGATAGKYVVVKNRSANAINVYPSTGHQFDALGANAPISLPINGLLEVFGSSATQWDSTLNAVINGSAVVGNIAGNAATVTTNANLTGEVTSAGNATTVTNAAVIGKVLTGYVSGAGTVAATDTVLQAINKLNGNDALKAPLTNAVLTTPRAISLAIGPDADILLYESATDTLAVRTGAVGSEKYFTFGANGAFSVNNGTVVVSATTLATNLNADLLDGQHGSYYAANVLTGYSSAPGTVAATDTVLQAIQKLNGNIAAASGNAASSLYLAANFGAL